ncbi:SRPBCC family protein [Pseudoxanthomonas wuyuanensis]|nr:SRPBCC family protein [Pseudoxanthomonas wuyuanensis]
MSITLALIRRIDESRRWRHAIHPQPTRNPMKITVQTQVRSNIDAVWSAYSNPDDITQWNSASDDWHTPHCRVDLREGGTFSTRMEAKDGSMGFDFEGTYTRVVPQQLIEYRMSDGREVAVHFEDGADGVLVRVVFDAETENSPEIQQQGWQSILDSFGRYVGTSHGAG